MRIQRLDATTRSQIAAGEVVERPASVLRELLDNSIDSGATHVTVDVDNAGVSLMRVTDNGCGMDAGDLPLSVERGATSKLVDIEDLQHIETLGFRGEALSSIASVAVMSVASRPTGSPVGHMISVDNGAMTAQTSMDMPEGTRVEVRDLFAKHPARQRFLRAKATENQHIKNALSRAAYAHPQVRFTVRLDGTASSEWMDRQGDDAVRLRIGDITTPVFAQDLVHSRVKRGPVSVDAWLTSPVQQRVPAQWQHIYVNHRWVQDAMARRAVMDGYGDLLHSLARPGWLVFVTVDGTDVDVNVHPAKQEVRFVGTHDVYAAIRECVRHAHARPAGAGTDLSYARRPQPHIPPHIEVQPQRSPPSPTFAVEDSVTPLERAVRDAADRSAVTTPVLGRPLACLNGAYVLAEHSDGLIVVDLHAAHERIIFERLKKQRREGEVLAQRLLVPVTCAVTREEAGILRATSDALLACGLRVEIDGDREVAVLKSVPSGAERSDPAQVFQALLADLQHQGTLDAFVKDAEHRLANVACRMAWRAPTHLSQHQMEALLREMETTDHAGMCSHGRPTWMRLTWIELDRFFLRGR